MWWGVGGVWVRGGGGVGGVQGWCGSLGWGRVSLGELGWWEGLVGEGSMHITEEIPRHV